MPKEKESKLLTHKSGKGREEYEVKWVKLTLGFGYGEGANSWKRGQGKTLQQALQNLIDGRFAYINARDEGAIVNFLADCNDMAVNVTTHKRKTTQRS